MYIPPGFGTVFPYMFVARASQYLEFLRDAFDARVLGRTDGPDGSVANARVQIGTTNFMLGEASEKFPPTQSAFYIYAEDVDLAFRAALEAGAKSILEPMDMHYEDRQGGVKDPSGNISWISKRLVGEPYDQ